MVSVAHHPWRLVAPWYRTSSVGAGGHNRHRAPILQKYAATDFANRLVAEPQQSLKFTAEDFVSQPLADPDAVVTPEVRATHSSDPVKLFLDLHSRFYVVVAELHCDMPGFPNASREEVCEAGFVIRRRVPNVPAEASPAIARVRMERRALLAKMRRAEAQNNVPAGPGLVARMRATGRAFGDKIRHESIAEYETQLAENSAKLSTLIESHTLSLSLQGWRPASEDGIGSWAGVEEEPQVLEEAAFPMQPIIADPTTSGHSATGRALWFGVIPTSSSDQDTNGAPRLTDDVLYEIRCFVRRHDPCCKKRAMMRDCKGEIVWSAPTEAYQIASPYDLDGASHRPFNFKMPDLGMLRDQLAAAPPGRGVNTRITTPPGNGMAVQTAGMDMPGGGLEGGAEEICFYFFLIFFIVAWFLFQLFLPILMFVLQLWFLLSLRLCIPPSIGFDAGLAADIKLEGELGVKLDAGIAVEFDGGVYTTRQELKDALADTLASGIGLDPSFAGDFAQAMKDDGTFDLDALADLFIAMSTDFSGAQAELAAVPPNAERGLVYFDKVLS